MKSARLNRELILGQRKLRTLFVDSPPQMRKAGELLRGEEIYQLQTGWACQLGSSPTGRQAITDVFLPGDMVCLDSVLYTVPPQPILALTAVTMSAVAAEDALMELMAYRPAALYIAWLLGRRQQRAERLLAAISCLDAPGRLAVMLLDFYTRLRCKRLITGTTYNLPLNQVQIGQYLGLTMVHINRVLRSLREARIVSLEKHCVTILDVERLTRLADNGGEASSASGGLGKKSLIDMALPGGGESGAAAPIAIIGN
jgi:CRP/FNR family transcriptional regulator, anaerobic regulatory protein